MKLVLLYDHYNLAVCCMMRSLLEGSDLVLLQEMNYILEHHQTAQTCLNGHLKTLEESYF